MRVVCVDGTVIQCRYYEVTESGVMLFDDWVDESDADGSADATERDATERDATERDALERDPAESDAGAGIAAGDGPAGGGAIEDETPAAPLAGFVPHAHLRYIVPPDATLPGASDAALAADRSSQTQGNAPASQPGQRRIRQRQPPSQSNLPSSQSNMAPSQSNIASSQPNSASSRPNPTSSQTGQSGPQGSQPRSRSRHPSSQGYRGSAASNRPTGPDN